jgi:hypothetical protein
MHSRTQLFPVGGAVVQNGDFLTITAGPQEGKRFSVVGTTATVVDIRPLRLSERAYWLVRDVWSALRRMVR